MLPPPVRTLIIRRHTPPISLLRWSLMREILSISARLMMLDPSFSSRCALRAIFDAKMF